MVEETFNLGIDIVVSEASLEEMAKSIRKRLSEAISEGVSAPIRARGAGAPPRPPTPRRAPIPGGPAAVSSIAAATGVTSKTFINEITGALQKQNEYLIRQMDQSNARLVNAIERLLAATTVRERVATGARAPTDPHAKQRRTVVQGPPGTVRNEKITSLSRAENAGRQPVAGVTVRPETKKTGVRALDEPSPAPVHPYAKQAEVRAEKLRTTINDLIKVLQTGALGKIPDLLARVGVPEQVGRAVGGTVKLKQAGAYQAEVSTRTIRMGGVPGGGLEIKNIYDTVEKAIRDRLSSLDFVEKIGKIELTARRDPERAANLLGKEIRAIFSKLPSVAPGGVMKELALGGEAVVEIDLTGQKELIRELQALGRNEVAQIALLSKKLFEYAKNNQKALEAMGIEQILPTGLPEERAARAKILYEETGFGRRPVGARIPVQTRALGRLGPAGEGGARAMRTRGPMEAWAVQGGGPPRVMSPEMRELIKAGEVLPNMVVTLKTALASQDIVPELHEDQPLLSYKAAGAFKSIRDQITQTMAEMAEGIYKGGVLEPGQVIGYEAPDVEGFKKPIKFDPKGSLAIIEEIEKTIEQGVEVIRLRYKELMEMGLGGKITTLSHQKGVPRLADLEAMGFPKGTELVMSGAAAARRGDVGIAVEMMSTAIADQLGGVEDKAQEIRNEIVTALEEVGDIAKAVKMVAARRGLKEFTGAVELPPESPLRAGGMTSVMMGSLGVMRLKNPLMPGPGTMGTPYLDAPTIAALKGRPETAGFAEEAEERMRRVGGSTSEYIALLDSLVNGTDAAAEGLRVLLPEEFKNLPSIAGTLDSFAGTILDVGKAAEAFAIELPARAGEGKRFLRMPAVGEELGTRGTYKTGAGYRFPTEITRVLGNIVSVAGAIRAERGQAGAIAPGGPAAAKAYKSTKGLIETQINAIRSGLQDGREEVRKEAEKTAKAFIETFRPLIAAHEAELEPIQYYKLRGGERVGGPITAGRGMGYLAQQAGRGVEQELLTMRDYLVGRTARKSAVSENIPTAGLLEKNFEALQSAMSTLGVVVEKDEESINRLFGTLDNLLDRLKKIAAVDLGVRLGEQRGIPAQLPYMGRQGAGVALGPKQLTAIQFRTDIGAELKRAADVMNELELWGEDTTKAMKTLEGLTALQEPAKTLGAHQVMIHRKDWEQQVKAIRKERAGMGEEISRREAERRARFGLLHRWPTTGEQSFQPREVVVTEEEGVVAPGMIGVAGPFAANTQALEELQGYLKGVQEALQQRIEAVDPATEEAARFRTLLSKVNQSLDDLNRAYLLHVTNLDFDGDTLQLLAATGKKTADSLQNLTKASQAPGPISDRALIAQVLGAVKPTGQVQDIEDYGRLLAASRKGPARGMAGLAPQTREMAAFETEALIGPKKWIGLITDAFNRLGLVAEDASASTSALANTIATVMLNINEPLAMKGGAAAPGGPLAFLEDIQSLDVRKVMAGLERGEGPSYEALRKINEAFRERRKAELTAMAPGELATYAEKQGLDVAAIQNIDPKKMIANIISATDIKAGLQEMMVNLRKSIIMALQESGGWSFAEAERVLEQNISEAQQEVAASRGRVSMAQAMRQRGIDIGQAIMARAPEWQMTRRAQVGAAKMRVEKTAETILAHARGRARERVIQPAEEAGIGEVGFINIHKVLQGDIEKAKQAAAEAATKMKAMYESAMQVFKPITAQQLVKRGYTPEKARVISGTFARPGTKWGGPEGQAYISQERRIQPLQEAIRLMERFARGEVENVQTFEQELHMAAEAARLFGETISHERVHEAARTTLPGKMMAREIHRGLIGEGGPLGEQKGAIFEAMKRAAQVGETQKLIETLERQYAQKAPGERMRAEEWIEPTKGFKGTYGEFMGLGKAQRAQYLLSQQRQVQPTWQKEAESVAQELLAHQTALGGRELRRKLKEEGVSGEAISYLEQQFGKLRAGVIDKVRDEAQKAGQQVWEALESGVFGALKEGATAHARRIESRAGVEVAAAQRSVVGGGGVGGIPPGGGGGGAPPAGGPPGGRRPPGDEDGDEFRWQEFLTRLERVLLATQRQRQLKGMYTEEETGLYRFADIEKRPEIPEAIARFETIATPLRNLIQEARRGAITGEEIPFKEAEMRRQVGLARRKLRGLEGIGPGKISSAEAEAAAGRVITEFRSAITATLINEAREAEKQVAKLRKAGAEPGMIRDAIHTLEDAVRRVQDYIEQSMEPGGAPGLGRIVGGIGISQRGELMPEAVEAGLRPSGKAVTQMIQSVAGYGEEGSRWLQRYGSLVDDVIGGLRGGIDASELWAHIWEKLSEEPETMGYNMKKLSEIFLKMVTMNIVPGRFSEGAQDLERIGKAARTVGKALDGIDTSTPERLGRAITESSKATKKVAAEGLGPKFVSSVEAQYKSVVKEAEDYKRTLEKLIKAPAYEKMGKPRYFQPLTKDIVDPETGKVIQKITVAAKRMGDQVKLSFQQAGAGANHLGRQLRSAFRRVVQWGFASGIVYGLVRAFRQAGAVLTEVEDKMMALKKVMDTAITNFDKLQNTAVGFAKQFGISIGQVLDGMVVYGQQGLKMEEITERTRATLLAVNVTTLSAVEATEALTAAHKVFSEAVSSSEGYVDAWGAVAARHAITAKDLADSVKRSGAAAKTAGVSFNDFMGVVTAIGAVTRQTGKEIATGTKFMFRAMRRPTAQKELLGIGVASKTITGDLRPAMDILAEVADKWDDLSRAQQLSVAQAMAGIRHYNAFIVLMENFKEAQEASIDASNSQGFATRKNALAMQTFHKQAARLRESINALVLSTGKTLLPMLTTLVSGFTGLLDVVDKMPDSLKRVGVFAAASIVTFAKLGDVVLDTIEAFAGEKLIQPVRAGGLVGAGKKLGLSLISGITGAFTGGRGLANIGKSLKMAFTLPATGEAPAAQAGQLALFAEQAGLVAKGLYKTRIATVKWAKSLLTLKGAMTSIGVLALVTALVYLGKELLSTADKGDEVADALFDQIGKSQDLTQQYRSQAQQVNVLDTAYRKFEKALEVFQDPEKFERALSEQNFRGPITALKEYEKTVADVNLAMARIDPSVISGLTEGGDYVVEMGTGFREMALSAADAQSAITASLQLDVLKAYTNELKNATDWWSRLKEMVGFGPQGPLSKLEETRKALRELTEAMGEMGADQFGALGAQAGMVGLIREEVELRGQVAELAIKTKKVLDEMPTFENIELGRTILNADEMRKAIETSVKAGAFGREATPASVLLSTLARSAGLGGVITPGAAAGASLQMEAALQKGIQGRAVGRGGVAGIAPRAAMILPPEVAKRLVEITKNIGDLDQALGEFKTEEAINAAQVGFSTLDKVTGEVIYNYVDSTTGKLTTAFASQVQQAIDETGQKIAVLDRSAIKAAADRTQKFLTMQWKGVMAGIREPGQVEFGPARFRDLTTMQRVMRALPADMQRLVEIQEQFAAVIRKFNEDISGVDEEGLKEAASTMAKAAQNLEILERDTIEMLLNLMKEGFNLTVLGHYQSAMEDLNKTIEDGAFRLRELAEEERDRFEFMTHTAGALAGLGVMPGIDFGKRLRELTGAERLQLETPGFGRGMTGLGIAGRQRDAQFEQLRNIRKQRVAFEEMVADLDKAFATLTEEEARKRLEIAATGDKEFGRLAHTIMDSSSGIERRVAEQTPVLNNMLSVLQEQLDVSKMPEEEKRKAFAEKVATAKLGDLYEALGAGRGGAARSLQFMKRVVGARAVKEEEVGWFGRERGAGRGGFLTTKGVEIPFEFKDESRRKEFERLREEWVRIADLMAGHQVTRAKKLAKATTPEEEVRIKKKYDFYAADFKKQLSDITTAIGNLPEVAAEIPKWASEYISGVVPEKVPGKIEVPEEKLARQRQQIEEKRRQVLNEFMKAELEVIAGIKDASTQMSDINKKYSIAVQIREFGIAMENLVQDFKKAEALAYEKVGSDLEGAFARVGKPGFKTEFEQREEEIKKKYGRGLVSGEDLRARAKEMADLEYDKKEARIKEQQDTEITALRTQQQQAERVRETIADALFGGVLEGTGMEQAARNYMDTLTRQLSESEQATMRGRELKFRGIPALKELASFAEKIKERAKEKAQEALIDAHRKGQIPTINAQNATTAAVEAVQHAVQTSGQETVRALHELGGVQGAVVEAMGAPAIVPPAVAAKKPALDWMKTLAEAGGTFEMGREELAFGPAAAAGRQGMPKIIREPGRPPRREWGGVGTGPPRYYQQPLFPEAGIIKGGKFAPEGTDLAGMPVETPDVFNARERLKTFMALNAAHPPTQIFSPTGALPEGEPLAFSDQARHYGGMTNYNLVKEAQERRMAGDATSTHLGAEPGQRQKEGGQVPGELPPPRKVPVDKSDAVVEATSEMSDKLDELTAAVTKLASEGLQLPTEFNALVDSLGDTMTRALGETLTVKFDNPQPVTIDNLDALATKFAKVAPGGADVPEGLGVRLEALETSLGGRGNTFPDVDSRISRAIGKGVGNVRKELLTKLGNKLDAVVTTQETIQTDIRKIRTDVATNTANRRTGLR